MPPDPIYYEFEDISLWLMKGWKWYSLDPGMDAGLGTCLIGEESIQYFQQINLDKKLQGGFALPVSMVNYHQAKGLKKGGFLEYFDFDFLDMKKLRSRSAGLSVYIEDEFGERYKLNILKKYSNLIETLKSLY